MHKNHWTKVGQVKRAGVLVPLFSVYSKNSIGIGDFSDLRLLADWCAGTANSILQLLPMNEVGPTSCPYDAVSSFALEPAYISLRDISCASHKDAKRSIEELQGLFLPGKTHVDYRIKTAKIELLRRIYLLSEKDLDSKDFRKFESENSYWLNDFALFKVLKSRNGGKPWYEWAKVYRDRGEKALQSFAKVNKEGIIFEKWVQWIAFTQFAQAKKTAASKGVFIKGDLPILISRDSADVWANPGFFKLDFAAGAPPDMYCAKGQRWGMPTYDWEKIAADGYRYVKEKLKYAGNFYDILRIDHVVGLFRIWSIPYDDAAENEGLNGIFDPKDEALWGSHGRQLLSVILESTNMLLCAEDLGMIPNACPEALKEMAVPGNEVQRWVKDWSGTHDFLGPKKYRQLAVSMLSTHDTTNWAAWWENEAGTVDEALFLRKCAERGIDYEKVNKELFDPALSGRGRLRWRATINSEDVFLNIMGKPRSELADFLDIYLNTYKEKEKLWADLGFKGAMKEKSSPGLLEQALKLTLDSESVFAINTLVDYMYLDNIIKGDPYLYRINRPGTVSPDNWSLTIPIEIEKFPGLKICKKIKEIIKSSGRA
ncbi:MAG: 4-alpha-glucanotransferase [Candidatus Omnitrophota bacterium]